MKDHLISTARLRERREQVREKVQEQRRLRADSDPFFKVADWLLSEWEQAEKDAAKEYVPTAEAARLTGWSAQTLRAKAKLARAGDPMPDGWEELQARSEGSEWSFCISSIPVKNTAAA